MDAPPEGDQYVLPVELADTVQGVSSEQRLHDCPGRVAIIAADGSVLRGLQSFQLSLSHCG